MTLKDDAKFKKKDSWLEKWHSRVYKNLHFDELLFSKVYKALDEKVQKS